MTAVNLSLWSPTIIAATAIAKYRMVDLTGNYATAAGYALGSSSTDGTVGKPLVVDCWPTVKATASAAIAAGAELEVVGTVGKVVTKTTGKTVARAMEAAAGADQVIQVMMIPN